MHEHVPYLDGCCKKYCACMADGMFHGASQGRDERKGAVPSTPRIECHDKSHAVCCEHYVIVLACFHGFPVV